MALRTDEESGDYIVEPFTIHFEDVVSNDSSLEPLYQKARHMSMVIEQKIHLRLD